MIKGNENTYGVTWIILNAVKDLSIGKYKLSEFLKGSKAKDVAYLSGHQGYGGLLWHDIQTIVGFIGQLEEMELIKRRYMHDFYSVIELTEAGKKVLDEKVQIELLMTKKEKPVTIGNSEKLTLDLFKRGKGVEETAKARNLAVPTIYDHLYRLVANDYLSCSEFVPETVIKKIIEAKQKLPNAAKLKEIKEMLPENISYNEIKCVLADRNMNETRQSEDENQENEFWSEGYFAQAMNSEEMKSKMRTFHMKHDEEMDFNCENCKAKISAHNKDWHNEMCDDCFNKKHYPYG